MRNARATVGERVAALLPQGGAEAVYLRTHLPSALLQGLSGGTGALGGATTAVAGGAAAHSSMPSSSNPAIDIYQAGLDATWQIDIFGGTRRRVESARATAQYQQAELEDAEVTLTVDVAKAYVNLRDAQHRLALTNDNVGVEQHMVDLTRMRRAGGTATDLDVERQITQLKQTQADQLPLAGEVEIYTDQLAQLAGQTPGALDFVPNQPRALPLPPAVTPVGDPASMIRRRPDIRAAERQIAAENAMIGYNISQYFPTVTLLGTIGYASTKSNTLFTGHALTYLGGPSITWNIFNIPSISAQVEESRASTQQARDNYRKTVLSALLDAENGLSRFGHQRDNVGVLKEADNSARRSANLAQARHEGGTLSLVDQLDIERQRIQAQTNLAQGQAQLTTDWISLQSSLGSGWGEEKVRPGGPSRYP